MSLVTEHDTCLAQHLFRVTQHVNRVIQRVTTGEKNGVSKKSVENKSDKIDKKMTEEVVPINLQKKVGKIGTKWPKMGEKWSKNMNERMGKKSGQRIGADEKMVKNLSEKRSSKKKLIN